MASILHFPVHRTSAPKKIIHPAEQQLLKLPVKPSISERHPDLDGQIFELELEKVRAKCALELPAQKSECRQSMYGRLVMSLNKHWGLFISAGR